MVREPRVFTQGFSFLCMLQQIRTMKYLLCLLLLLVICRANAQPPVEKSLLWKITGNGMAAPSYLYGTYHLLCPEDLVVDSAILKSFAQTRQLYLEIDMSDKAAMTLQMMQMMKMKDGQDLNKLLSSADYDSVASLFQKRTGLPLTMVSATKPILLSAMLYPAMMGCQPESWEETFIKMSEGRNMKIGGLETMELQMSVLDSIPYKEQADHFKTALYRFDSMKLVSKQLIRLYKSKDIKKMYDEIAADTQIGDYESVLLEKRNKSWIPVMEKKMKAAPSFFAVGAGHLAGNNGVINLLRKRGYKVKAMM